MAEFTLTAVTAGEMNSSLYLNKDGFEKWRKAFASKKRNFIGVETQVLSL
jgi:hypothetical protein